MKPFNEMSHDEIALFFEDTLYKHIRGEASASTEDLLFAVGIVQAFSCPHFLNLNIALEPEGSVKLPSCIYDPKKFGSDNMLCQMCRRITPKILDESNKKGDDSDE